MPDYIVKADVDSMLRADNDAGIRSAIGLGQTDAPTFLAQSLTGQSLTGTQATSLVDLAATWNTTGNPSLIYGRVTNTNSGTTANLIDLGTSIGGSLFKVDKTGAVSGTANITGFGSNQLFISTPTTVTDILAIAPNSSNTNFIAELAVQNKIICNSALQFGWGSQGFMAGNGVSLRTSLDTILARDAPGILAQRNGDAAQAFRLYNFYNTAGANYERGEFVWSGNTLFIQAIGAGSGVAQPLSFGGASISFRTSVGAGYVARWNFSTTGHFLAATHNTYDIGAAGGVNCPKNIYVAGSLYGDVIKGNTLFSDGLIRNWSNPLRFIGSRFQFDVDGQSGTGIIQIGGTTDAFPAIARDGAGIKFTGAAAGLTSWIKVPAVAVASLPAAATAGVGARSFVNDALTPVFGSAVTGGGAVAVPVYSTGSAWNVG
jgi:hypothetical protein